MRAAIDRAERWQVPLFLAALALGAVVGLASPEAGGLIEPGITPVLALLLFFTFLGVPFGRLAAAVRDLRFAGVLVAVNFVAVPAIAWALSRLVAHDDALLVGVLLVLLTPCIDYVVVFTGLAGGDRERLLAATPLLMVLQTVLLPGYLWLMAGPGVLAGIDPAPFVSAFVVLIVLPLALAALVQVGARRWALIRAAERGMPRLMVPAMMLTLFAVVASQVAAVAGDLLRLAGLVPLYAGFAVAAAVVGAIAGRMTRLAAASRRALVFSAVTRNSLVVLPLALALPPDLAPAALAVVTQTLVELIVMVVLVFVVPRTIGPAEGATTAGHPAQ